ncbi:MAG: glycosyltransferase family 4 protein [Candidatus Brocadiales bacterium]|nr:glycosyltransferase family 4 protein [Candidatus Brocadiales bacterium]
MLRVYNFLLDHRVGGPHVYVDTLRKALGDKVESIIVTTGRGSMTDMALLNLRHFWSPLYGLEMIANSLYLVWSVLSGRISRKDVIFNVHGSANIAPIAAARIVGIPVVWHIHETVLRFRQLVNLGKWLMNQHPHTFVVVANKAKEVYGLGQAEFIPGAVDTDFWSRSVVDNDEVNACWSCDGERPFRVLAVGNINPLKGMDILLEAMASVAGPWHLKIVGPKLDTHREYAEMLYRRAGEIVSKKKDCVIDFLGWHGKTEVRILLAGCDLFVLPSRSEACPIVLLEAIAMDCDCVAADVGDVSTMIEHYSRSRVFPAGSVGALISCIEQFQVGFGTSDTTSARTEGRWQVSEFSAKTMQVYNSLTGKN